MSWYKLLDDISIVSAWLFIYFLSPWQNKAFNAFSVGIYPFKVNLVSYQTGILAVIVFCFQILWKKEFGKALYFEMQR